MYNNLNGVLVRVPYYGNRINIGFPMQIADFSAKMLLRPEGSRVCNFAEACISSLQRDTCFERAGPSEQCCRRARSRRRRGEVIRRISGAQRALSEPSS